MIRPPSRAVRWESVLAFVLEESLQIRYDLSSPTEGSGQKVQRAFQPVARSDLSDRQQLFTGDSYAAVRPNGCNAQVPGLRRRTSACRWRIRLF
jgi:hypothetical protein